MKTQIRQEVLKKRDSIPPDVKVKKDLAIKRMLYSLPEFLSATTVLFYASFRSEVNTFNIIQESLEKGKKVILPKVDKNAHVLKLYRIKALSDLNRGYMGISEPLMTTDENLVNIDDVELVIIPGAGFDYEGNRLGYGAGYYDILLSKRRKKMPVIALAYDEQLVDLIPAEEHDVKIDLIITDKRVIRI
jgi:5-formyltetrahydrofolate cyclo-ligase